MTKRVYNKVAEDRILQVIASRAAHGESVPDLAREFGRNPSTTASALIRLRSMSSNGKAKEPIVEMPVSDDYHVGRVGYPLMEALYRRHHFLGSAADILKEMGDDDLALRLRFRASGASPLEVEVLRYLDAYEPDF